MENNHYLLMRVLKLHYKDRQHILDGSLKALKEYSNKQGSTQSEYDELTATLSRMLDDLPKDIMRYFLTMVPLPKNKENLALNFHDALDIQIVLKEYLKKEVPALIPINETKEPIVETKAKRVHRNCDSPKHLFKTPKRQMGARIKRRSLKSGECKSLLDICSEYVIENYEKLNQEYHASKDEMWELINTNTCDPNKLELVYGIIRELNKKIRWLRLLEADEISEEIVRDVYFDEDIFVKEKQMDDLLQNDPFSKSPQLESALTNFLNK